MIIYNYQNFPFKIILTDQYGKQFTFYKSNTDYLAFTSDSFSVIIENNKKLNKEYESNKKYYQQKIW